MKNRLVSGIFNLAAFFIIAFAAIVVYPHPGIRSAEQSKQSGNDQWNAPAAADKLKNPLAENKEAALKGKNLFKTYCVTCHGESGKGNGPQAASLNPKPHDLTSEAVQKESDGAIYWKISTGKPPMLAWQYSLTENQRWQLVDFIRQLEKNK
jgi:mono/diheme cytochrome c family protein